jgi:hypothetical protein
MLQRIDVGELGLYKGTGELAAGGIEGLQAIEIECASVEVERAPRAR